MDQSFLKNTFWHITFLGNSLQQYTVSIGLFLILLIVFWFFRKVILLKLESMADGTSNTLDNQVVKIIHSVRPEFYVVLAFLVSIKLLVLNQLVERIATALLLIVVAFQIIQLLQILIDFLTAHIQKRHKSPAEKEAIGTVAKLGKGVLWVIGLLVVLQNIGVQVSSLIAGLGIGGVAVAFALQNILGDLFSSFAIIFDKPFEPGDFIVVGEHMGVVEDIGIKTTRIRALQGEEIVISNAELTNSRIRNFKKMKQRRVTFIFGVLYQTSTNKLKMISQWVREIVEAIEETRFDRAHFNDFGDSGLQFEVVYYVESGNYNTYMDVHQQILIAIKEKFDQQKIEIAYPTQTIHLAKT